ncbi:MAG: GTP-binding protein, partial [Bacillota bacterium]
MSAPAHVVAGTAGHVDHGKTALIRALTGVDTDRLPEEKARGISIDLGFARLALPGGTAVSFVDVPGHEKFIKNMLAGATGVDLVLLVIAADEGVMPQTREHLDILSLLGLGRGLVAVTKTDLVDPDWLALIIEEARELVRGTFLDGAPVVPVSAVTGEGLPVLTEAIAKVVAQATPR